MARWIDLSHAYHLERFTFITHLGTHVDAPLHFIRGGRTIDSYELGELGGEGWVLPLDKAPNQPITVKDLEATGVRVPLRPKGFGWPVHHLLLGHGVLIAENLANLTSVAGRKLLIGAFPLKIKGGDGPPARIFAVEE